jgi:HEPN domain-containing protein
MKTRAVDRFRANDYIKRAEESLASMENAYENGRWSSCVINAIQCAISAADAYCIFKKGLRNASESHSDSIVLFSNIDPNDEGIKTSVSHLSFLISIKSDAQYGERLSTQKEAEQAKKHAERLFEFVKERIK